MRVISGFLALAVVACGGTTTGNAGTLVLQAFGGASGHVAAQVPLLAPGVGPQQTCGSPLIAGACQLTSCTERGIGSLRPGQPGPGPFGTIDASVGTTTVPITYDGSWYPTVYFPSSVTLGTGGTMTFRLQSLPGFEVSATIPGPAIITSPVPTTPGGSAIIDTSRDLSVTWLPISIGEIDFELHQGGPGVSATAISIACTFGGAAGSGVVPQTLLSSIKEMAGSGPTYARVSSELTATTVVNGLTVVTQSYGRSPTAVSSFDVTLR